MLLVLVLVVVVMVVCFCGFKGKLSHQRVFRGHSQVQHLSAQALMLLSQPGLNLEGGHERVFAWTT